MLIIYERYSCETDFCIAANVRMRASCFSRYFLWSMLNCTIRSAYISLRACSVSAVIVAFFGGVGSACGGSVS